MRAIDQLKAAVSMKPQRKDLELPNGEQFSFYMTPTTLSERQRAQKNAKSEDATDFALTLLCSKATDENGQKLFAAGEAAELRNALPASLVEQVMLLMLQESGGVDGERETPEEAKKPSRKTAS